MAAILIVDDLTSIHEMLEAVIQPMGHKTAFTTDGEKALARFKAEKFDLVLSDIDMKPMDGLALLKQLKLYDPSVVVILMTAYANTESAIQALKFGAFDLLQKPFKVDELLQTIKRGMEYRNSLLEHEKAMGSVPHTSSHFEARLVGTSQKNMRLIAQLKKLAEARAPILISGEMGSGHEVVAELLHAAGSPAGSPLVRIDCQLSSIDSLRTGLLGQNGAGGTWVQQAKGGTLFLLQLQFLPKETQAELVSVIRNNAHKFRLICSTEVDLEKLAETGKFNEELFYRIASLPVQLPPLRERCEDIPDLLKDIAAKTSNQQFDTKQVEFTDDALVTLKAYRWPGNLAEFRQVVSQVITTTETRVITSAQLPLRIHELQDWPSLAEYLAVQEKQYLARVLNICEGDKNRAAKILGIDRSRLG
jgi:two-component system, NtrC family, response regulator HydG